MNEKEKLVAENNLKALKEQKNEIIGKIQAENSLDSAKELDEKVKAIDLDIIKAENALKEAVISENKQIKKEGNNKMAYLTSENSVKDLIGILKDNTKDDVKGAWKSKLSENGVEVEGDNFVLPRKLVESIQTALTDTNPVFKVFRVTNVGALLVSGSLTSSDEANVHVDGQDKKEQSAVIKESTIEPVMIYKLQKVAERVRRVTLNYAEIYNMLVAEMTQAIVNKAVDLALVEGKANSTTESERNGFIAVMEETNADVIKKITATAGTTAFSDAVESAVDFLRGKQGAKYLIVTATQRKALLDELRALPANAHVRIKNDDVELASEVGVDEIIVYTGTKAIKPIVLRDQAYHIDMQDLTRVDAFEWKTNENALLIESLSSGHADQLKAGAVITLP